jgi:hypothetical protein
MRNGFRVGAPLVIHIVKTGRSRLRKSPAPVQLSALTMCCGLTRSMLGA